MIKLLMALILILIEYCLQGYTLGESCKNTWSTMIVPLSDAQLKDIRATSPRSQAEIDQDVEILRHWLNKQPHLPKTSKYFSLYINSLDIMKKST